MRNTGHERYRARAINSIHAQHVFQPSISHIFDSAGKKQSLDKLLAGEHGNSRWNPALSNEWGRLAQGNNTGIECTNTIDFVPFSSVPQNKKVTYASFACDHRPLKAEQ